MRWPAILAAALCLAAPTRTLAQVSQGTPEARAEFERGQKALEQKQVSEAVAAFRHAIDLDPAFLEAHEEFAFVSRWRLGERDAETAKLRELYARWIAANPRSAVLQFMAARVADEDDLDTVDGHYRQAVALDPTFARAWWQLALHATRRGDQNSHVQYLKRATEMRPDDPQYQFQYAYSLKDRDPAEWTRRALAVADRFAGQDVGAQTLYWLGFEAPTTEQKLAYYERAHHEYSPAKFGFSRSAMKELFSLYAPSQPEKAMALGREALNLVTDKDEVAKWRELMGMELAIEQARTAMANGMFAAAVALLDGVKLPSNVEPTRLNLLRIEAEAGRDVARAYNQLADLAAVEPREAYVAMLSQLAARLKRTAAEVTADLRQRREKQAKPAPDFTLTDYTNGTSLTLSSLRGQVVLLNFWYPS